MLRPMMKPSLVEPRDDREVIDQILEQTRDFGERTVALSEALRVSCPHAAVYACALIRNGERYAHAINGSGVVCPNWRAEILELAARAGNPSRPRLVRKASAASLSRQSGVVLKVQNVEFRREIMGVVAIGLDASSRLLTPSAVDAMLRGFSTHLAANLFVERRETEAAREIPDLESLCGLAKIGELIDPVAHEVNNFLNAALLHMAVMQSKLPAESRDDLTEIREQGVRLTETIRQLQQYRRVDCRAPRPIDLNSVVCASVEVLRHSSAADFPRLSGSKLLLGRNELFKAAARNDIPVRLALAPKLPMISASGTDLQYLCTFLLKNAVAATAPSGGDITVRTAAAIGNVSLRVDDTGPAIAPELLPRLFEPSIICRAGTNSLELAACKSLVKRLKGKIQGANQPGGGVSIQVELPVARL